MQADRSRFGEAKKNDRPHKHEYQRRQRQNLKFKN